MKHNRVLIYEAAGQEPNAEEIRRWEAARVERLQAGDLDALGELFQVHHQRVYRTALALTRDERAAEDIVQECFVRLYRYASSVDSARPLQPWLYRVTVNLAHDWASGHRWQPLDDILEWLGGRGEVFPSPDREVERREMVQVVREAIAELPLSHRAVIVLHYLEDLSLDEIAQVLDIPVGTVKSRLHYARQRLRVLLTQRQVTLPEMLYELT